VFSGHGNRSGSRPSPLTTRHVSRLIRDLAARAGIAEVGVTPHYFRHVFATRALDRTGNLALVQDMLGHASPATTRVYARTDEEQRRAGYSQVWEGMEHRVDVLSGWGGEFDLAVPIVRAVRVEVGEGDGADRGERLSRLRCAAMVEVLWATGCSLEELVALRLEDVDLESGDVRFVSYSMARISRLTPEAVAALQAYLQVRGGTEGDAFFAEDAGAPLTRERAFDILRSAAKEAGIVEESVPPDLFRRAFVRRALDAAGDPDTVRGMVGQDAAPRE
jgi:site-specific recombinase XerD